MLPALSAYMSANDRCRWRAPPSLPASTWCSRTFFRTLDALRTAQGRGAGTLYHCDHLPLRQAPRPRCGDATNPTGAPTPPRGGHSWTASKRRFARAAPLLRMRCRRGYRHSSAMSARPPDASGDIGGEKRPLQVTVESRLQALAAPDADHVVDVRQKPHYWVDELRHLHRKDQAVADYVLQPGARDFARLCRPVSPHARRLSGRIEAVRHDCRRLHGRKAPPVACSEATLRAPANMDIWCASCTAILGD